MGLNCCLDFFGLPTVFSRYAAGARDENGFRPGAETTFTAQASIQSLSGRERESLPEGFRDKEVICVLCEVELRTANVALQTPADRFTWQGRRWEICWHEVPDGSFQMMINYWEGYATLLPSDNA